MLCFYFLSISIVLTYVIPILGLAKLIIFIFQAILRLCPRHFRFQECAGKLPGLSSSIIPTLISHCHALLAIRRVFICTFSLTIWILRYVLFLYVLIDLFKEIYIINLLEHHHVIRNSTIKILFWPSQY